MVQSDLPFLVGLHLCGRSPAADMWRPIGIDANRILQSYVHVFISRNPRRRNLPCFPKITGRNENYRCFSPSKDCMLRIKYDCKPPTYYFTRNSPLYNKMPVAAWEGFIQATIYAAFKMFSLLRGGGGAFKILLKRNRV